MRTSVAELQSQGFTLSADEAVAIAQQLISALTTRGDVHDVQPPYGPPSSENVFLRDDGSVICSGCDGTPAVSEVGIFLNSLLAAGAPRVPGGLRYTIARALLDVDVPPFDSLADLSRDLERHEHGDRYAVVRGVLARSRGVVAADGLAVLERRRSRAAASTIELRRALREAEVHLYEHQPRMLPVPIDVTPVQPRGRSLTAAAACLAAGLALIGAGEFMHPRQPPIVLQPVAPAVAQLPAPAGPLAEPPHGTIVVRDASSRPARATQPEVRRVALRRTPARPAARSLHTQPASRHESRSVLDRLKLGWLRTAFSAHSDM